VLNVVNVIGGQHNHRDVMKALLPIAAASIFAGKYG
jgi:hypothetical protein